MSFILLFKYFYDVFSFILPFQLYICTFNIFICLMFFKKVYTKTTEMSYDEDRGIVFIRLLSTNEDFDLEEAKLQHKTILKFTEGEPYLALIDTLGASVLPSKEAEQYIANVTDRIAEAIVIESLPYRIVAKFYMKKSKHNPTKIFKTKEEAIDWLLSFRR